MPVLTEAWFEEGRDRTRQLYMFLERFTVNHRKSGGFKQHEFILREFWRQKG